MIKITFKEAGHGDSIILEWENNDESCIGIIDCNLRRNGTNPVLDHLSKTVFSRISFILLSHPHYDHYSGLRQVLEHCEKNSIFIGCFLHTAHQVPAYLKSAVKTNEAKIELKKLFKKVHELYKNGFIGYPSYVNPDRQDFILNSKTSIRFLSPSSQEDLNYLNGQAVFADEEKGHNNANANWLSSVLKIYTDSWYLLLTSDAERRTLGRLGIKNANEFREQLIIAQSPHHGANDNHYPAFWKHRKGNAKDIPIVFSVGSNSYNHPSQKTVESFQKLDYQIYSTNQVGGLSGQDYKSQRLISEVEALLDNESKLIVQTPQKTRFQGDQTFEIDHIGKVSHK